MERSGSITPPAVQYVLLYITMLSRPFMLVFRFFEDANEHETTHDVLSLNNTYSVYSKVRNGRTTHHTQPLQILFPDGWTTLRLTVAARTLSVAYVLNKASKEIISQPLDHDILELSFNDTAALCSARTGKQPCGSVRHTLDSGEGGWLGCDSTFRHECNATGRVLYVFPLTAFFFIPIVTSSSGVVLAMLLSI